MFFTDPSVGMGKKIQGADSTAYCIKGTRAIWEFYPDEDQTTPEDQSADSTAVG